MVHWKCINCAYENCKHPTPTIKLCGLCGCQALHWRKGGTVKVRKLGRERESKRAQVQQAHRLYLREQVDFDWRDDPYPPALRV